MACVRSIQVKLDKNGAPGGTVIGNYATIGVPRPAAWGGTGGVWLTAALLGNRPQLLVEHVPDRQPGIRRRGLHHPRASSSPPTQQQKVISVWV